MSDALTQPLPCPFCGDNDGLTMTDGSTYRWGYAYCSNCGASAGEVRRAYPDDGKWYEDAIQQWNKRAAPTPRKPEPSAVKHMMRWVDALKRISDDGQHMNIPGLSSGACWELAVELEQFIKEQEHE